MDNLPVVQFKFILLLGVVLSSTSSRILPVSPHNEHRHLMATIVGNSGDTGFASA